MSRRNIRDATVGMGLALAFLLVGKQETGAQYNMCSRCISTYCFLVFEDGFLNCRSEGGADSSWCTVIPYGRCDWVDPFPPWPPVAPSGVALGEEASAVVADDGTLRSGCGNWVVGIWSEAEQKFASVTPPRIVIVV
jgi:hypothetical protein